MRLALFDLDHTLIPFDSTLMWLRLLVAAGEIGAGSDERYLARCRCYVAGTLDVAALHECALAPLAMRSSAEVAGWQARLAERLATAIPHAAHALIARHRDAGETCCLVTNTCDVVAGPFARALGIDELICSRAQCAGAAYTGRVDGEPCHGPGKVRHVGAWLDASRLGPAALASSCFYSDSISDLPLMSLVATPVAVAPDRALRAHALARGWRIADRLDAA